MQSYGPKGNNQGISSFSILSNPRYGVAVDIGPGYLYSAPGSGDRCVTECIAMSHIWISENDTF